MAEESWRRWGEEDERGALNLIGAAEVKRAAALVREGRVISLAQPISDKTAIPGGGIQHYMKRDGGDYAAGAKRPGGVQIAEDVLIMPVHLGTHIDALCHVWYDDALYNGFSGNTVRSTVAQKCGVEKFGPLVTRGVLLDVVAHRGASPAKGDALGAAELQAVAEKAGLKITPGDAVLIRTAWLEEQGHDADVYFSGEPGIDAEAATWLAESGAALVGVDNYAIEVIPFPKGTVFPVHQKLLRDYGVPLLEGLMLGELSASGAREFLFTAAPIPFVGATGSPLCPIAVL